MKPDLTTVVFTLVFTLISTSLAFAAGRLGRSRDKKSEKELSEEKEREETVRKQEARIAELQQQMAVLMAQATPINAAYQAMLIAKLTHLHTPEMDALLAKLGPPSTLTEEEAKRLEVLLAERMVDMDEEIDDDERIAAKALPLVAQLTVIESEREKASTTETVMVSQPTTDPAPPPAKEEEEK